MEAELVEIREFLSAQPPFDRLPAEVLDRLTKELSIRYFRRGSTFPPEDENHYLYIIRTGAIELRNDSGALLGRYGKGELYPNPCLEEFADNSISSAVIEDSLFYLLPCRLLAALREKHGSFSDYFSRSVAQRLRIALSCLQQSPTLRAGLTTTPIGDLIARAPITIPPDRTIRDAASLMTKERISSLLVVNDSRLVGIITDRDLRSRCVAEDVATTTALWKIMTSNVHTCSSDIPGFEALLTMTRLGIHHLPVVDDGRIKGLVSLTDLVRAESANTVYLADYVRKSQSLDDLLETRSLTSELQIRLVTAGVTPYHMGLALSSVTDAVTVRLIQLAEAFLGPAPIPYAWMAAGSHARSEQTLHSDQDHALILSDEYRNEKHVEYFKQLARFVTEGLYRYGFAYCPGNVMATNPDWRQPYSQWRQYFETWISAPDRKALMLSSNFFDMRVIHGDPGLWIPLQAYVLKMAKGNTIFLAQMARSAVENTPPLGFFRQLVLIKEGEHAKTLDLKHRGVMPITELGRVYALASGEKDVNTYGRLRAAAKAHMVSVEGAASLEDAFALIGTIRAIHQSEQMKKAEPPDNYLCPEELSSLERNHLKDAFVVIGTMQAAMRRIFQ